MKYLFKKSKILIFFFVMTGFLLTIAATAIQTGLKLTMSPQDFLTSPYARLTISQRADGPTVHDLNQKLLNTLDEFILYKVKSDVPGKELSFKGGLFRPEIIKGRGISQDDIANEHNVALVSLNYYLNNLQNAEKQEVSYDGRVYEVVGVYSTRDHNASPIVEGQFYVSLNDRGSRSEDLGGEYFFGSKHLARDLQTINAFLDSQYPSVTYRTDIVQQDIVSLLSGAIEATPSLYMALLLTLILLLLHISTTTGLWCNARMYEISVKRLCGATVPRIFLMLARDYLILFSLSYLTGWAAAALLLMTGLFPFVGTHIYIYSSLFAYLVCLVIGMAVGMVTLYRNVSRLDIGALN